MNSVWEFFFFFLNGWDKKIIKKNDKAAFLDGLGYFLATAFNYLWVWFEKDRCNSIWKLNSKFTCGCPKWWTSSWVVVFPGYPVVANRFSFTRDHLWIKGTYLYNIPNKSAHMLEFFPLWVTVWSHQIVHWYQRNK